MESKNVLINKLISGKLHFPKKSEKPSNGYPAVLFLHGFATDKNEVNNVYEKMAERLSNNNIISLRIDFYGYGESKGKPENSSIDTMILDGITAYKYLISQTDIDKNKITIVGFSLGAAIAMLIANSVNCNSLVLISPACNFIKDFSIFLGEKTIKSWSECENFIELELPWRKINLGKKFYLSLLNHDPIKSIKTYSGLITCYAGEEDFSSENVELIEKCLKNDNLSKNIIKDADHIFNSRSGNSKLFDISYQICNSIVSHFTSNLANDSTLNKKLSKL